MRSILSMVLLVSSCSSTKRERAAAPNASGLISPAIKREWRECREDDECTHVWNCRDSGTAVNKKFGDRAQDTARFGCKYSAMRTPTMESSCNQGICESTPTPAAETPVYGDPMDLDEAIEAAEQAHRRR